MTELIRPARYQACHNTENLTAGDHPPSGKYDVARPIWESGDCFGKSNRFPATKRGDIVAMRNTGAYGEVMSSSYNLREKAGRHYSTEVTG